MPHADKWRDSSKFNSFMMELGVENSVKSIFLKVVIFFVLANILECVLHRAQVEQSFT